MSHLYGGGLGEDEEEEVMATVCHIGETYSAIKPNRQNDEYYKQLNQYRDGLVPSLIPSVISHSTEIHLLRKV